MKLSPSKFYSVTEICELLRIEKKTAWNWASERKFTTYKVSGGLLFDAAEVNEAIERGTRMSKKNLILESKLKRA